MSILDLRRPPPAPEPTKTGVTQNNERFAVPPTPDMFYTLTHPSLWGPSELLVMATMTLNLLLFALKAPLSFHIFIFLFWRLSYNLGLGAILSRQSRYCSYTNWILSLNGKSRGLVYWAVSKSLGRHYNFMKTPVEFNAWIGFRALAMLVLANDGWTYFLLSWKCWQPLTLDTHWDYIKAVACFVVGILLLGLCAWVKADAHDCVGDFAWYWGDFFFKIDGSFTSKGVFQFFPHPMYTVGYSAYYGCSLIARSYALLVVSLVAHLGQIAFLMLVEEPHMEKIYGGKKFGALKEIEDAVQKEQPKEMIGLKNFSIFRSSDVTLAFMLLTTIGTSFFAPIGKKLHIVHLCLWWAVRWIGLGLILKKQSSSKFWTKHFETQGLSEAEAYTQWKRIYNFSVVMSETAFVLAAIKMGYFPYTSLSSIFSAKSLAYIATGLSLALMNIYCVVSVNAALGSYGYYFGDFFVETKLDKPVYTNIYKYTNNPGLLFGHLAHYGVALIMCSREILALSLCSHVLHYVFVYNVELPHFRKVYKEHRASPALQQSMSEALSDFLDNYPALRTSSEHVKRTVESTYSFLKMFVMRLIVDAYHASERIVLEFRDYMLCEKSKVREKVKNSKPYRKVLKIGKNVKDGVRKFDAEDIVKLLERRGIKIEHVDETKMSTLRKNNPKEDEKHAMRPKHTVSTSQSLRCRKTAYHDNRENHEMRSNLEVEVES